MSIQFLAPGIAREIGDKYKDIAAHASIRYPCLCAYIAMLINGSESLCGFSRLASWTPSVSTLSRSILNFSDAVSSRMLGRNRVAILNEVKKEEKNWVFVIDTTKNLKRTFGIDGFGLWHDSNNNIYKCQNLLVICAVHAPSGAAIPLHYLPCLKPSEREDKVTANHLVIETLDMLVDEGWPKLTVIMDSWFDGAWLIEQLKTRKFIFVVELKSRRKPKENCGPRVEKQALNDLFKDEERYSVTTGTSLQAAQNEKYVSEDKQLWVGGSEKDGKQIGLLVCAVYNDLDDEKAFGYYATNDLSKSGAWLWTMSRCRWNIEVMFRDLKQYLAWGKLAAKSTSGVALSQTLPFIIVGHLRLKHDFNLPLSTILKKYNQVETIRSLQKIDTGIVKTRVQICKNRLNPDYANKKPISSAAEKGKSEWTSTMRA